VKLNQMQLTP